MSRCRPDRTCGTWALREGILSTLSGGRRFAKLHNMTNKKTLLFALGAVIVILVVAGALVYKLNWKDRSGLSGELSVVYVTTGEGDMGKLWTHPKFAVTDAYKFQTTKDPADPLKIKTQLIPFSTALWAPRVVYFNREQVVFYGPLSESSKVFQAIKNKTVDTTLESEAPAL